MYATIHDSQYTDGWLSAGENTHEETIVSLGRRTDGAPPYLGRSQQQRRAEGLQPTKDGGRVGDKPALKITDIKTFLVGAGGRNWLYVKVLTDQGIFGIGEAYSAGPDEATVKVIEDFKSWLVGHDPRNVQYLFDLMYNTTRFPGGLVAIRRLAGLSMLFGMSPVRRRGSRSGRCWAAGCEIKYASIRALEGLRHRSRRTTPNVLSSATDTRRSRCSRIRRISEHHPTTQ